MLGLRTTLLVLGLVTGSPLVAGQAKPVELATAKLLVSDGRGLAPSPEAVLANGRRVRIEGFMALMEEPPGGGFWLCPRQVFQDESGASTGDLPPNSVFVVVKGAVDKPISYVAGKISVSGVFRLKPEFPRFTVTLDSQRDVAATKSKGPNN